MRTITLILILYSGIVDARFYGDLGVGWIEDLPGRAEVTMTQIPGSSLRVEESAEVNIESPFFLVSFGYEYQDWYFEYNRFGVLDNPNESISTFRVYKRWWIGGR